MEEMFEPFFLEMILELKRKNPDISIDFSHPANAEDVAFFLFDLLNVGEPRVFFSVQVKNPNDMNELRTVHAFFAEISEWLSQLTEFPNPWELEYSVEKKDSNIYTLCILNKALIKFVGKINSVMCNSGRNIIMH